METVKIAHLYYDLMNLYGEHGNILAITHHLEEHNIHVITHTLTIEDEFDFTHYDFIYIGSGNKEAFELVREDILKKKKAFQEAMKQNKIILATGNAIDLFGKSFRTLNEIEEETLGLFSYEASEIDFRIVGEQVYNAKFLEEEMIGFQNRNSVLKFVKEKHLFDVKKGTGYVPKAIMEGIHCHNFYGTYLLGPICIRNPHFTEYLVQELCKYKNISYKPFLDETEIKAYQEYKKNLLNDTL